MTSSPEKQTAIGSRTDIDVSVRVFQPEITVESLPTDNLPRPSFWGMLFMRLTFVGYFVYLTMLLLTKDPLHYVGHSEGFLQF